MPFTNTFVALSIVGGGLWVVCSSVFATMGWTAPACLSAVAVSAFATLLGGLTDLHAHRSGNGNTASGSARRNPNGKATSLSEHMYRLHDDNDDWLEAYEGRMHELYGTNKSVSIVNMKSGYLHNVHMWNGRMVVRTDVKQVPHTLGRVTGNRHRNSEPPMLGRPETFLPPKHKRETPSESSAELSSYFFSGSDLSTKGQNLGNDDGLASYAGDQLANQAYQLGTYCMTLSNSAPTAGGSIKAPLAKIGATLIGLEYKPTDQGPCSG